MEKVLVCTQTCSYSLEEHGINSLLFALPMASLAVIVGTMKPNPLPSWYSVTRVEMSVLILKTCFQTFICSDKLIRLKFLMLICS